MTIDLPADSPLKQAARQQPTLVVLLRSFGCTFCREAIADVASIKPHLDDLGIGVAFVHTGTPSEAQAWFARRGLQDVTIVSDPALHHYRAFGLGRTKVQALVDPAVWARGAVCALSHGFGAQSPDEMRQLPGVFVVRDQEVLAAFRHRSPADRPDYLALARDAVRGAIE